MKKAYQFLVLLSVTIILFSCYGGVDQQQLNKELNEELQEYVERFKEEANLRGLDYENRIEEIEITVAEILNGGVLGQCQMNNGNGENSVQIDKTYWKNSETSDLDKEFVVFHELGHCILDRDHLNTANNNGVCSSIMYDGNNSGCMLDYNLDNREEMIDELFQ